MAKKLGKGEKLDLILSELSVLRGEVKKLLKQTSAAGEPGLKAPARPRVAKKAAKRAAASRKPAKAVAKPILVEPAEPEPPVKLASRGA
jgi:hypothetical protein